MKQRTILIQLDSDRHPSTFDRVVAIDAGADEVFSYGFVQPEDVQDLVHGAIFTRGAKHLARTAIFIGGSDVTKGEELVAEVRKHMIPQFGLQVSVLMDANGCNTTAAAAVKVASNHMKLKDAKTLVLAGTGPVGQRVARLLAGKGAHVRLASRKVDRAENVCHRITERIKDAQMEPVATGSHEELVAAMEGRSIVFAAGAAGVQLLPASVREKSTDLKVAIDLNAVPPLGLEGVGVADKAQEYNGVICYGAVGVGGTKMKIHKAAIDKLFQSNDQVMDAEEVFALAGDI